MQRFVCYYFSSRKDNLKNTVDPCIENHETELLKYREPRLNEKTGTLIYLTKIHEGVIPSNVLKDQKCIVVSDELVYIRDVNSKQRRLNTPKKAVKPRRQLPFSSICSESDDSGKEDFTVLSRQPIQNSPVDNDENENHLSHLLSLIPSVIEELKNAWLLDLYIKFNDLLASASFPTDNICYLLFLDVVAWFSCENTTLMRHNPKFWQIGFRLFHGKFLRFKSGMKNLGQVVGGITERGIFDPVDSCVNFAVPSRQNLYHKTGGTEQLFPEINEEAIKHIANHFGTIPLKLAFDGKKNKSRKGKKDGGH